MRRVLPALVLLALAPLAAAQASNIRLGVSVSGYFFSDSRLRNAFGNPTLAYGANLTEISSPGSNNKISFAYDFISANRDDSSLFIIPLTLGYVRTFADPKTSATVPYFRLGAGGAYYDVAVHDGGYNKSFKTFGAVGSAEVGVVLSRVVALRAKYFLFQNRGVPLSGLQLGLVYNFGRL